MRSYDPKDKSDKEEVDYLKPAKWMLMLLKLNPAFVAWSEPEGEDNYTFECWADRELVLNDRNEIIQFYFEIKRSTRPCTTCGETGLSALGRLLDESFYDHHRGHQRWCDKLTLSDVQALVDAHRLCDWDDVNKRWVPHAPVDDAFVAKVNLANSPGRKLDLLYDHDAINKHILITHRCKQRDMPALCTECNGRGEVPTEEKGHVALVLWQVHTCKARLVTHTIERIEQEELPEVFALLKEAAARNAKRFELVR